MGRRSPSKDTLIVYRACPQGNAKNKIIEDKYELVKYCFNSFVTAFKGVDHTLKILLDKPDNKFRGLFKGYDVEESYHSGLSEGNVRSFHRQIDLALEHGECYLFVEDDYYFFPHAGMIMEQAVQMFTLVSPYDHPAHYEGEFLAFGSSLVSVAGRHWRTIPSTTLTFGGGIETLAMEAETMKKYGWGDHPMFLDVTRRYPLYSPIPTLATHMEVGMLSPNVVYPFLQTSQANK